MNRAVLRMAVGELVRIVACVLQIGVLDREKPQKRPRRAEELSFAPPGKPRNRVPV